MAGKPHNKGKKGWTNSGSFKRGNQINKGKKLSEAHKQELSKAKKGKHYLSFSEARRKQYQDPTNHPNWQGGITPMNKYLRCKSKIKIWRELVFLRDKFTCQNLDCEFCQNKQGILLNAHHIKPLAVYPEIRFDINNGITYCAEFHIKSGMHRGIQKENGKIYQ